MPENYALSASAFDLYKSVANAILRENEQLDTELQRYHQINNIVHNLVSIHGEGTPYMLETISKNLNLSEDLKEYCKTAIEKELDKYRDELSVFPARAAATMSTTMRHYLQDEDGKKALAEARGMDEAKKIIDTIGRGKKWEDLTEIQ